MPCSCKNKGKAGNSPTSNKVVVRCSGECTEGALGTDGLLYPIHQTAVIVSKEQALLWIEQGFQISYA